MMHWTLTDICHPPTDAGVYPTIVYDNVESMVAHLQSLAHQMRRVVIITSEAQQLEVLFAIGEDITSIRVYEPIEGGNPWCAVAAPAIVDEEVAFSADDHEMYFKAGTIMSSEAGIAIVESWCRTGVRPTTVQWRRFVGFSNKL